VRDQNAQRRRELAHFLRSRRAKIDPEHVGLPKGTRRRTPGLRREEVAVLAGVSPTWYTYLEQGRDVWPSWDMVDKLANVLCLSGPERIYLHDLVQNRIPPQPLLRRDLATEQLLARVVRYAGPYPVYALNQFSDMLSWNAATAEWYTNFQLLPKDRRNMLWWMLTSKEAPERIARWEGEVRDMVGRFRALSAKSPGDPRIAALADDLADASPHFRRWWDEREVRDQSTRIRYLRHPHRGIVPMRLVVFHEAAHNSFGIEFHLPEEDADDGNGGSPA